MPQFESPGRASYLGSAIGNGFVALVAGVFAMALGSYGLKNWQMTNVDTWPQVEATIVDAELTQSTLSSRRTSYRSVSYYVLVSYEFKVGDISYQGSSSLPSSNNEWEAQQEFLNEDLSAPERITVSYSPSDPNINGIDIESSSILATLLQLGFASVAGIVTIAGVGSAIADLYSTVLPPQ